MKLFYFILFYFILFYFIDIPNNIFILKIMFKKKKIIINRINFIKYDIKKK